MHRCRCAASGLIPARAGSTGGSARSSGGMGAHPRPCGEHAVSRISASAPMGSSPPVRGALANIPGDLTVLGLIPARAGSTRCGRHRNHAGGAHPRPCGEHAAAEDDLRAEDGSSPPVRGARAEGT